MTSVSKVRASSSKESNNWFDGQDLSFFFPWFDGGHCHLKSIVNKNTDSLFCAMKMIRANKKVRASRNPIGLMVTQDLSLFDGLMDMLP